MKKNVVIFGSGGLAKELIGYLLDEGGYNIVCVVSTHPFNNERFTYEVREKVGDVPPDTEYLMGVAEPAIKRQFVEGNEDRWATYIHKTAFISPHSRVGKGCVLAPQVILAGDCTIGDFVFMNTNATVGHDSRIGDYSTMMPNTEVCGNVMVGEGAFFGIGSYVLSNKNIGDDAKISAGTVVRHPVPMGATV